MRTTSAVAVATGLAAYTTLQVLGRTSGSTAAERAARLPGDDLVPRPQVRTDHALTVGARAEDAWPWLTQVGWHRAGWYTPRWVDRLLFPANWPSLDRLDPDLVRELRVGDTIPDGPPGTAYFVVVTVEPPSVLVLHSTTHLPPGWETRYGARLSWTWCFRLIEVAPGRTRVHLRVRGRTEPWWLTVLYVAVLVPADHVMALGMLRGLRTRVEPVRSAAQGSRPTSPRTRS